MKFAKYQALGNDYIVINPVDLKNAINLDMIQRICHRNFGIGSDGILLGPQSSRTCDYKLQIFNPDGSEAEKSGNGLRIFARYLVDRSLIPEHNFTVETLGGNVSCEVSPDKKSVTVAMGVVSFDSTKIPVEGRQREVLNETMEIDGRVWTFCAATVGNPHCVILSENPTFEMATQWGPKIETEARFPNRTNVQFMKVLDRSNIRIEIWERGAGYTLASGSSSTAAAGVACRLGLCDSKIEVHMPGGKIQIQFDEQLAATMTGPVTQVCDGRIADEILVADD